MMDYTVYNSITGEVLRIGSCKDDDLSLQAGDGEVAIEGTYLDTEYYWDGSGMVEKPDQPSPDHFWNIGSVSWELDTDAINARFRAERDRLLSLSDWTQFSDSPLTDAKKQEWATYRQALRDLPANTTDAANPVWPTEPE